MKKTLESSFALAFILLAFAATAWAGDDSGGWLGKLGSMAGNLVSGGLSGIFGGIMGIFGTGIQAYATYKDKQLTFQHEKDRWENDRLVMDKQKEMMVAEAEQAQKLQTIKEEGANVRSGDMLQMASYQHDQPLTKGMAIPDTWMGRWVIGPALFFADWCSRMTRPMLTIYYTIFTTGLTYLAYRIWTSYAALMTAQQAAATQEQQALIALTLLFRVADMVLFITCMSTTWWFGGRALKMNEVRGGLPVAR